MTRTSSRTVVALTLLPAVATMLFVQACGGSGLALADEPPDPIEGVWESVVTQVDCSTRAALASFRGAQAICRGGTLTDTSAAPASVRSAGLGVWSRNGDVVEMRFRFFRYNPDGSLAGSSVTRSVSLSVDRRTGSGNSEVALVDPAGTIVARGCATDVVARVQ